MIIKLNNSILRYGGNWLNTNSSPTPTPDPYNPLNLPPNTIRVKFKSGYTPDSSVGDARTLVDSTNNIWDIYKESNIWYRLFILNTNLLEVLGANTTNVTSMRETFRECTSLTSVALFDTSNVINMSMMFYACPFTSVPLFDTSSADTMSYMFYGCYFLTSIPLFDTSKVYNMDQTFNGCSNVETGALALYQQVSSQPRPPGAHDYTFHNCGSNTITGAAELAQIPDSWK